MTANTGAGPDVVVGWTDDPHLYCGQGARPDGRGRLFRRKKYGGWYPLAQRYGKKYGTDSWLAIPMGGSGGPAVYRESWIKAKSATTRCRQIRTSS